MKSQIEYEQRDGHIVGNRCPALVGKELVCGQEEEGGAQENAA
jgi:hypothetical protein